jgi:cytochrome P450 family 110
MALPHGPGLNPWQLLKWAKNPVAFYEKNAAHYGDMFTLRFPGVGIIVFVSDPADVQALFQVEHEALEMGDKDFLACIFGGHSLLVREGQTHRRQRRLLMPPFHGARMRTYGPLICRITQQHTTAWQRGRPVVMQEVMQDITLEII